MTRYLKTHVYLAVLEDVFRGLESFSGISEHTVYLSVLDCVQEVGVFVRHTRAHHMFSAMS